MMAIRCLEMEFKSKSSLGGNQVRQNQPPNRSHYCHFPKEEESNLEVLAKGNPLQ